MAVTLVETAPPEPAPAPTPEPTPAPTPVPTPAPVRYVVRSGDTISAIAAQFGVRSQDLIVANGLPSNGAIRTGQTLIIPR